MKIALYPGSFDPITMGHLDIIKRISSIFDTIIVGVINNPNKKCLFSLEKRKEMIVNVLKVENLLKKISVDSFDGLLIDYSRKKNINVVIRGLRATSDFEYELNLSLMNKELYPKLETFFLMAATQYSFISSNLIKEVFDFGGDISKYVSPIVLEELRKIKK